MRSRQKETGGSRCFLRDQIAFVVLDPNSGSNNVVSHLWRRNVGSTGLINDMSPARYGVRFTVFAVSLATAARQLSTITIRRCLESPSTDLAVTDPAAINVKPIALARFGMPDLVVRRVSHGKVRYGHVSCDGFLGLNSVDIFASLTQSSPVT